MILSSVILVAAGIAWAEVTTDKYPDADAVIVDEIERVSYNTDGTSASTDETWTKLLTEKGRRDESTLTIDYSKRYESAAIVYVGAIDANGVEREIDVSATMKEATDNSSMAANIYDPLDRRVVCTVPALKIGEVLHVKTERKSFKARCEGQWSDLSVMEWKCPILRSRYEVKAPAGLPVKRVAIRHPLGNVVTNFTRLADGSTVHSFTSTNSPQAFPEPDMPPLYTQLQHIRVSTAADWPEISRWYWQLCKPHLEKTNAAMSNKVESLGRDLRAIFKFVSQEVRYMGITMEDTSPGYAPHDVDITFDNRYGVCRDKAGLLAAMLRIAGYKAFPVLIHCGAKLDKEVPQPFFNHAIVAVDKGNRDYELMDPTNENTKDIFPSYLSDKSYLVARPEGEGLKVSKVPPPENNAIAIRSTGSLMKNGAMIIESEIEFGGINDTAYRGHFARLKPEDRVKFFDRMIKRVSSGAEIMTCEMWPKDMRNTEQPLHAKVSARYPESVLAGETQSELNVPFLSRSFGIANFILAGSTSLERRRFPLTLDSTAAVRETIELSVGGELGMAKELPSKERGELSGYDFRRSFTASNGILRAERSLAIGAVEFSPEEYVKLREEIKNAEAAERKRPVFEVDRLSEANVEWIEQSSETTVFSDKVWVTTNSVIKRILTYDGKKRSAEIKLPYNTHVARVQLLYATVSNSDGRVYRVTDREINEMDSGWAASAPRYPAGKVLIINLPSVEIGSTISYALVTSVTNSPVSFYSSYEFDSQEPIGRKVVRVNDWRREVKNPRRLANESNQPSAWWWRDQEIISFNTWAAASRALAPALEIGEVDASFTDAGEDVKSIRDWMARNVKIVGPSLYETPIAAQLTDPNRVVRERYATRLDYVRTLCSLLRRAGYVADVVFAASDANDSPALRERIISKKPCIRAFGSALCRVKISEGGWLGFGGDKREYFIGTENEYTPLGTTSFAGSDYFDAENGTFGIVRESAAEFADREIERSEYLVRDNGAVDLTVENEMYGSGVGGYRRRYAEMLSEERSRNYQAILGNISQAASATSELITDIEGYPAKQRFSCYIPDFATVEGEVLSLQVPRLISTLPLLTGASRKTPFAIGSADEEMEEVTVVFPEGYDKIEHLPEDFTFADPMNPQAIWLESTARVSQRDGRLVVILTRKIHHRVKSALKASFYELAKDWSRIADSRANRTISARRGK